MKKKILAILLAAILIAGFCGCSIQTAAPAESKPAESRPAEQQTPAEENQQQTAGTEPTEIVAAPTEIPEQYHWDLTPIFADAGAFQQELQRVEEDLFPMLSEFKEKLNTQENILAFMKQKDVVDKKFRKLNVYAMLLTEQDQGDNTATAFLQQVNKAGDKYSEAIAFYGPELLANSSAFLDKLLQNPEMEPFATEIERLRKQADHVLPEETELLLLPLSNAANGACMLFSKMTSADMEFRTIQDPDGNDIVIDEPGWNSIVVGNPDREFRKDSTEALLNAYGQYRNTFAQNMDNFVQATVSLAHSYQYASAKEDSMAAYTVPSEVYDNLITAVNSHLDSAHRYIELRKKIMGVDKIYSSDMNYPLVEQLEVSFSYEDAKKLIIDALAPLGEEYQKKLQKAFDERWIDVYPSEGKSGGAFSSGLYGVHPYVLMNFTGSYNCVSTLAHELGHAIHQYDSAENQKSVYNSDPTSFTSEVASTTNELLLADYMIKNAKSDEEKLYYMFSELSTLHNTFFTQAMFSEFEDAMYQIVEDGGSLNADNLEELWIQLLEKYNGSDCTLVDGSRYGWSRIPHFYYDFYVYQYATSIAAACTVSERIENGDEGALQDYLEFLKSGDSGDGPELIGITGVDVTSPWFADALIARYNDLIDQIEELKRVG